MGHCNYGREKKITGRKRHIFIGHFRLLIIAQIGDGNAGERAGWADLMGLLKKYGILKKCLSERE